MTQHMELVEDDPGLGSVAFLEGGIAERLPHIHDRQADSGRLFRAEPGIEQVQTRLRAVRAPEPDGSAAQQIADDDAVAMPFANGDLVDANDGRRGRASQPELLGHVLLVQFLDGLPIEVQLLRDGLDCAIPATLADIEGEPLRIERVVGQPVETFGLHAATASTIDPAYREGQVDAPIATGQVAHVAGPVVIPMKVRLPTHAADRFFWRRRSVRRTPCASRAKTWRPAKGTKPGKRYRSRSCFGDGIS